ncbi:carbohydrate kinase [Photobacterium jeanii]|uniref:Carbohydrate kinase n=1 Tax=Photobacterium jeanii TaxID=858640 RepID=A0A178K0T3_9GAMM|nr:UxaA family hydrolase [Photobacterium jeanii]OAN10891.1 carbohydrate kinase [Photobacterium jeanii]PST90406.1 carbohydrate kinase [Photobacterium jeanii]
MIKAIQLSKADNVATLLGNLRKGEEVEIISTENQTVAKVMVLQNIPFGNKVALCPIDNGQEVIKSGFTIGKAVTDIALGQLVHVQNVRSIRLDIPENIIELIIEEMEIEQ